MKILKKGSKYLICFLVLCGSLYLPVKAQKIPIALQNNTVLSPTNAETYRVAAEDYENNRTQEKRDRLIFMAVSQIDLNFAYYQKNRRYKNNLFQTVMDILEVGAATAISITKGERPKSIIADALGFIQGSRSSINKNLRLLEQQILFNKMIEKRSLILTRILDNTSKYTDAQYPFERAFLDVVAYYEAGTMDSALSALATDTGATAQSAQQQLAQAKRNAGIVLAPTAAQIRISRENSDFVQAIIDRYDAADGQITAANNQITESDRIIAEENARVAPQQPDAARIAQAQTAKETAQTNKTAALADQKKSLDDLKAIFNSIEQDPELSPLLDELPERYPNIATRIEARLARIRAGQGTIEEYGFTILQFLRAVVAAIPDKPTVVDRTKIILDSVR